MKARETITHFHQELPYSCGAAALRAFLDADEEEIRKLVKTKSSGTNTFNVLRALVQLGFQANEVDVGRDYRDLFWLVNLSCHFPLYISGKFVSQGKRGRPGIRRHAILAANGCFYDPSENRETPIDAFEHTFNKSMIVNSMIVIEHELPGWRKNIEKYSL